MKSLAKELPHLIQRYLLQLTELGNADTTVLLERDTFIDSIIHYDFFTYILGKMSIILILIAIKQVHYQCMTLRYHITSVTARTCH